MTLQRNQFQSFPAHLVSPSPWPLVVSFSLLILTVSAVIYFNGYKAAFFTMDNLVLLSIGLISVISGMTLWFRDVITEALYLGDHTSLVQRGITMGIYLFIVSEIFFFISIFWAYFHSSLTPTVELGIAWPPLGVESIDYLGLPLLNTALLLSSGATVTYSHHALIRGDRQGSLIGLVLTILLATIFTVCQVAEYNLASFNLTDSAYGTAFYFATSFHGIHVLVGTLFLSVGLFRIFANPYSAHHHVGLEGAILYFHFVDVVWLILYLAFYWWGS